VVRDGKASGKNESITERRYYCSCGFVNKTLEQVVVTWKKTEYKPREKPPIQAEVPKIEAPITPPKEENTGKKTRGRPRKKI
jgi:hypothetical protein